LHFTAQKTYCCETSRKHWWAIQETRAQTGLLCH
jgi:hypothetical protein